MPFFNFTQIFCPLTHNFNTWMDQAMFTNYYYYSVSVFASALRALNLSMPGCLVYSMLKLIYSAFFYFLELFCYAYIFGFIFLKKRNTHINTKIGYTLTCYS